MSLIKKSLTYSTRQPYLLANTHSRSQQDYVTPTLSLLAFISAMTTTVKGNVNKLQLSTAAISKETLDFLVPPADDRLIRVAHTLMLNPVSVTDRDMIDALELEVVDENFESEEGCEYFYIRSWAVSADDLALIIRNWEDR
ncbi:hypothetical protein HDU87_005500 [Geranomyces variabilis]|uniref:Uncharacterized protein n=1 Tax=Geranomyces variabilis TaxID=109894 RepID=A0AAD5TH59_9FUNG|nr:hypothetical protein HDU87_005500 [Geranomyces variabilis]